MLVPLGSDAGVGPGVLRLRPVDREAVLQLDVAVGSVRPAVGVGPGGGEGGGASSGKTL